MSHAKNRLILAIATADPEYAHDPETVLEEGLDEFENIAAAVREAGFVLIPGGTTHSVEDKQKLSDAVCTGADPDFDDYPAYVQEADRRTKAPIVAAILEHGFGIAR